MEFSNAELLNYALENGIIDLDTIQKNIEMNERKKYLETHGMRVWQGTNGKWYTYLPDESTKDGRRLVKRSTLDSLNDAIVEHYKVHEKNIYIEQVFYEWIESKLDYGEIKKQTYDRYIVDFNKYIKESNISNIKFKHITEEILEDYIKRSIKKFEMTSKMWGNLRLLLNGIFKYGKKKGYTNISITNFMGDLEISSKAFRKKQKLDCEQVFTDFEVKMISRHIMSQKLTLVNLGILLAFQTGLRSGELSALLKDDFIVDRKVIRISKTEEHFKDENEKTVYVVRDAPKTEAGFREVVVNDSAIQLYEKILELSGKGKYLFTKEDGERIKGYVFTHKINRLCLKLGIVKRSIHKARKTYATKLINANVNERFIMKQMGHKDISTTRSYYSFDNLSDEERIKQIKNAVAY